MSDRRAHRRDIRGLAVPITLAALISVLGQFAVLALLGRVSDQALYVRSLYLPMTFLFLALQQGLDASTQVAVAIGRGRDERETVGPLAGSLLRLGLGLVGLTGLAVALCAPTLAGLLCAPTLAGLLSAGAADHAVFVAFVRWTALASLAAVGPVVLAASLRGWGKAAGGAAVSVSMAATQVGMVALLGFGTGLGVFSVPVAMATGGLVGLLVGVAGWRRHRLPIRGLRVWRAAAARTLLGVGAPVAASYLLLSTANLGLLWVLSPFGAAVVSGFSAAYTMQTVLIVPMIALGSATAIVLNQSRGQGRDAVLPDVFRAGVELALVLSVCLAATAWFDRWALSAAVTGTPQIAGEVLRYLTIVLPTIPLMGLVLVAITVLEQLGAGRVAVLLNVGYFGMVLVIGGLLAQRHHDPAWLYGTIAATNLTGAPLVIPLAAAQIRRLAAGTPRRRVRSPAALATEGST